MTEEEIAVRLEGHEHEIGSLKHRMEEQEEQTKTLNDLVISVRELALNMRNMIEEQKRAAERLTKLENEPVEKIKSIRMTAIASIISTIAGMVVTAAIMSIIQYF